MKVGYLTSSLSSEGGVPRYSMSLVKIFSASNEIKVLTRANAPNEVKADYVYPVLPNSAAYKPTVQLKIFYQALKHFRDCDIIHSFLAPCAPGAALASLFLRIPFVMTFHGTYAIPPRGYSLKAFLKRQLMKFMYTRASIVTTGSIYNEKKIREVINNLGECRFIPNGVDLKRFYKLPNSVDKNYLLTVGELKPRKGTNIVIKALGLLKNKLPSLRYKIVGVIDNKSFHKHLKSLAKELGIENKVDFLGMVSNDELLKLYNQCSIFVLAARDIDGAFEGFPMVFYEAMGCGAPVISTKGFGSEYAIKNGVNGYVIEPDNPKELASTILKILSDKNLHNQLRQGALKEARNHAWDRAAQQLIKMYKDALKK